jgi:putative heme-binding domain-containing protein
MAASPFNQKRPASTAGGRTVVQWLLHGLSFCAAVSGALLAAADPPLDLQQQLAREDLSALARAARAEGDAQRGVMVFYQSRAACSRCHGTEGHDKPLGPDLARVGAETTDVHLIESVLQPSKVITEDYQPITVITDAGKMVTGLLESETDDELVLRDDARDGQRVTLAKDAIDERIDDGPSIMPTDLANQLGSRAQFLDLVRYLMEIVEKGPVRAKQLRPPMSLLATRRLPDYEHEIDHEGMIAALDAESLTRGETIYERVCINCHGTADKLGTMPTSLRFATGKFKSGGDPFRMYQTLTYGYGMMAPQTWMVPQQKYDVIHYIREAYLKKSNPTQYVSVHNNYLAALPQGTSHGPEPSALEPWVAMDYGSSLIGTYEIGNDDSNFAYKGIAIRLDGGTGGVTRGHYWMVYDHDTLRAAAGWSGEGFIDFNGVMFNGRHEVHPRVVGTIDFANPIGPGWGDPDGGEFADPRLHGRDGRCYGPLPRHWAHYRGLYHFGNQVVISYRVGTVDVLEMPGVVRRQPATVFSRTLNIGPRPQAMVLQVASTAGPPGALERVGTHRQTLASASDAVVLGPRTLRRATPETAKAASVEFDGITFLQIARSKDFDLAHRDYTIHARVKTRQGGTIFSSTAGAGPWAADDKSLFVRNGRLVFDVGWVGAVTSKSAVSDGQWHDVAMTYQADTGAVRLYIDGRPDAQGRLEPRDRGPRRSARIGYTANDFPTPASFFTGAMEEVRFYDRALSNREVSRAGDVPNGPRPVAQWRMSAINERAVPDQTGSGFDAEIVHQEPTQSRHDFVVAGVTPPVPGARWTTSDQGDLRLHIPAGPTPLRFTLWLGGADRATEPAALVPTIEPAAATRDLTALTRGGPPRWPSVIPTEGIRGDDDRPLAVDVLPRPVANPWLCRVRMTGLDFLRGGRQLAVCTWDGDVWLVRGIETPEKGLTWQRIASGLFQPLGLKVVDGQIYVACRDQIVILRDLNGDGETDFYQNFNNDHQVTEHFHEFALGLQTDGKGNFYYAKGARHGKPALVPQHGTLLRVSKDGGKTEIVACGFRAPNGVCVDAQGRCIVTDQEGHWMPKNRINWVVEGGFYGNTWGYHDSQDTSDAATQPPLCWITNQLDRSPAEVVRVASDVWGPLNDALLSLSYGYGKVFVVLNEEVEGLHQGGVCELPIPQFPTGIMRGRFHPQSGQLFACGMFAWAGNQQQPGGLYRVRATGKPLRVPVQLHATRRGLRITFSTPLDRQAAADTHNYGVTTWTLKRTANYGSEHYNEKPSAISGATLLADGKTVLLDIPHIQPTWCMEIRFAIRAADGAPVEGVIHNTIHRLSNIPM